jgi:UrcA family protein
MRVSYADLDVTTQAGATTLYARIRGAAEAVCRPLEGKRLSERAQWKACYEHAVAEAVQTVNRPALTALYKQHQHLPTATAESRADVRR